MASATADQVKALNGSKLDQTAIEPFLTAAACVMAGASACMTAKGIGDDCLTQAEAWLAAHFMEVSGIDQSNKQKKSEKFEGYSVVQAQSDMAGDGIMATRYGKVANTLTMGCLQETDKRSFLMCSFG